jgi:alkylated DNA repair dioxygenase AlkB
MIIHLLDNARLSVHNKWLSEPEATRLMEHIQTDLTLIHNPGFTLYGKPCVMHRDIGFFTDAPVKGYRFFGQIAVSQPLSPELWTLLQAVNEFTESDFNAILINRYNSKEDYIGAHSDDESALGADGVFALSLGGERIFRIRDKATKTIVEDLVTTNGQLLGMCGSEFQKRFTHEVPSVSKSVSKSEEPSVRISLTFRKHLY